MKSLSIWDIDDTLFKTTTFIHVKARNGKRTKSLTPQQFNTYKLKKNEDFDFSEFRSASHFANTAQKIDTPFKTAKKMMEKLNHPHKKVVLLTARGTPDHPHRVRETFRKHGFDIDRVDLIYSGDRQEREKITAAESKKRHIREFLKNSDYDIVRMFDDSIRNINSFMELQAEFPNTKFEAFLVNHGGTIQRL